MQACDAVLVDMQASTGGINNIVLTFNRLGLRWGNQHGLYTGAVP